MEDNESLCSFNVNVRYVAWKGSPEPRDVPGDLCSLRGTHTHTHSHTLSIPPRHVVHLLPLLPLLP